MKKWMKTAAAAFIGAAICTAAGSLSASADVTPDGDTLILSGNVTKNEVQAYANNEAVKKVVCEPGTVFPEYCDQMFRDFKATSIDLSGADTSNVQVMSEFFLYCSNLTEVDLTGIDTSSLTSLYNFFSGCTALKSLDVSNFDTSSVEDMGGMFSSCSELTSLNISSFDTAKCQCFNYMFFGCKKLTELNVSGFDTSSAQEMAYMFANCENLTELDVTGFDTSNVTDMSGMFASCIKLTELDVTGFDTSKVQSMGYMFSDCDSIVNLDLSNFDTHNVMNFRDMFSSNEFEVLDLSSFDTSSATDMQDMFCWCSNLKTILVSELWSTENLPQTLNTMMFRYCNALVGGNGTVARNNTNVLQEYAQIDGKNGQPGYLTFSGNYVKGASLTLNGKIGVNFYVSLNSKAHTVVVTDPVNETEYPVSQIDSFKQADGSYKIPGYVNSTQAGKAVTLKILDEDGEQLDLYNSDFEKLDNGTVSYSVNDYIADTAQYSDDALVKDLVQKLDTYCKAAENYFCGTSHALDIPAVNITKTNNFNKQFKISLVLDSGTALRIYSDAASAKRMNGANEIILAKQQNAAGKQYYEISDIRAQYLLNDVTVVLDGVTYKVNPMDYCAMVFAKDGGDPNLTAVCAALYHYGNTAKAYAESIQN